MSPTTRLRMALARTFPTLLAFPPLAALAAFGVIPWPALTTVPIALAVQAAVTYRRLTPSA